MGAPFTGGQSGEAYSSLSVAGRDATPISQGKRQCFRGDEWEERLEPGQVRGGSLMEFVRKVLG